MAASRMWRWCTAMLTGDEPVLVRVHTHCLAGDVFWTTLCDCRAVMQKSLRVIAEAGRGALVYLHNASGI